MPPRGPGRGSAASARLRRRARPLSRGLPDLRHAQRRQVERRADLPCADARPVRRRPSIPSPGKEGWWESLVGPGKVLDPARYFIICINVLGGCMGTTGPLAHDPARPAVEPALPGGDRRRHGARPGGPARPSRHPRPVLRDRRLDGRHAGAGMGGELSRRASSPPCRSPALPAIRRRTSPSTRSAARRSWPIPSGRAATTRLHNTGAGARARGGAHDRAHHLSFRAGAAAQVRPRAAGPRRAGLRLRCRFPGRELPALPGLDLRRSLRRQQLPLHHARDGLFRPRRARMAACWPTPSRARRRASACSPSPATGCSRRARAARSCMR